MKMRSFELYMILAVSRQPNANVEKKNFPADSEDDFFHSPKFSRQKFLVT